MTDRDDLARAVPDFLRKAGLHAPMVFILTFLLALAMNSWMISLSPVALMPIAGFWMVWAFLCSLYTVVNSLRLARQIRFSFLEGEGKSPIRMKRAGQALRAFPWRMVRGALTISFFMILATLIVRGIYPELLPGPLLSFSAATLPILCVPSFFLHQFFMREVKRLIAFMPSADVRGSGEPTRTVWLRTGAAIAVPSMLFCFSFTFLVLQWLEEAEKSERLDRLRLTAEWAAGVGPFRGEGTLAGFTKTTVDPGQTEMFLVPSSRLELVGPAGRRLISESVPDGEAVGHHAYFSDRGVALVKVSKQAVLELITSLKPQPLPGFLRFLAVAFIMITSTLAGFLVGGVLHTGLGRIHKSLGRFAEWKSRQDLVAGGFEASPRFDLAEMDDLMRTLHRLKHKNLEMLLTQEDAIESRVETQQMKSQFFTSMSHELRSPLNSIIGFAELLLKGIEGEITEGQRTTLDIIYKNGEGLLKLINTILDSAKLEAGRLDLLRQWVPSVEVLGKAVRVIKGASGSKSVEFSYELQAGLPPIYVDEERLVQAIASLLANAAHFLETGVVFIRSSVGSNLMDKKGPFLIIEIQIRGVDAGSEERKRLKESMEQRGYVTLSHSVNLGLGLSLAKSFIEMHGGGLMMEPERTDRPLFTVIIPLEGPEAVL